MPRLPGMGPGSPMGRWAAGLGERFPVLQRFQTLRSFVPLLVGMAIVGLLAFVQVSSTPQFCGTCHIMKPYYQSWKHSAHNKIACVECHISPGLTAEVRKKFEALSMVAKYFTATYGTKPWAEVDDAACLRCHQRRLLEGRVEFHGVSFDHRPHLTESRRGLRLRCTSCHSQIVQGEHLTVTTSTCALCHFKGQPANAELGECRKCHEVPQRVQLADNTTFDHSEVERRGMNCVSCHEGIVRGTGEVPRERCLSCHNQPDRLEKYTDKLFLHRQHVTEHKVDCQDCHGPIEHGIVSRLPAHVVAAAESAAARPDHAKPVKAGEDFLTKHQRQGMPHTEDLIPQVPTGASSHAPNPCESCHGGGHDPQQQLYAGRGARGVPDMPSVMYVNGVRCQGCHDPSLVVRTASLGPGGPEGPQQAPASAVACMSCHGPGYKRIYAGWVSAANDRTEAMRRLMEANAGVMGVDPPKAWDDARHNFLLVSRGHGVHNVTYAYAVLEKAYEQLNAARAQRGLAPAGRPWPAGSSSPCLSCHTGIEKQVGEFLGRRFQHGPHLGAAKLDCEKCHRKHSERPKVEIVRFGPDGCTTCHHENLPADKFKDCFRCHDDINKHTVRVARGEFSHKQHRENGEECVSCHKFEHGDPRPPARVCLECHD